MKHYINVYEFTGGIHIMQWGILAEDSEDSRYVTHHNVKTAVIGDSELKILLKMFHCEVTQLTVNSALRRFVY